MRVVLCGAGHIGVVHAANLAASDRVSRSPALTRSSIA